MKWFAVLIAFVAFGAIVATTAFAATPRHTAITIRHEVKGCHSWALGSNAYASHLVTTLRTGGSITFTDNDVMSHQLIMKSGPAKVLAGVHMMSHIGATAKVTFPRAGTYRFTTKAGEDYTKGIKTVGEDHVLTLTVTVR